MDPLIPLPGRAILRKHAGLVPTDIIDVSTLARVEVTSEQELYPIDHLFDGRNGPGGSCWMARSFGPQSITLRFHRPLERLATIAIESEERSDRCAQRIEVTGWSSQAETSFKGDERVFEYAPYGTSFHRATWTVGEHSITHLCIKVSPTPGRRLASLTAIVLRSEET